MMLVLKCLMGRAEDPMSVSKALDADDADEWQKYMKQKLLMINKMAI